MYIHIYIYIYILVFWLVIFFDVEYKWIWIHIVCASIGSNTIVFDLLEAFFPPAKMKLRFFQVLYTYKGVSMVENYESDLGPAFCEKKNRWIKWMSVIGNRHGLMKLRGDTFWIRTWWIMRGKTTNVNKATNEC